MENVHNTLEVTLVVTSCNRFDLLKRTLESFAKFNTYPISEVIVIDDGDNGTPSWFYEVVKTIKHTGTEPKFTFISNDLRKGQIYSVDRAYAEVKTPYIFHCEDDWEFEKPGFIEKSFDILLKHPKIFSVNLRNDWQHPIVDSDKYDFQIVKPDWDGGWGGFSFNPGLRRLADYQKIGSYGKHVGYNPYEVGELYLSKLYLTSDFNIAHLADGPYVQHIGWGNHHVDWATAPKPPKVLIAIPMCWRYEYKSQDDNNIHKSRESNARIDAQRATWIKDLTPFKSYVDYKYFYGRQPEEAPRRDMLKDEILLDVPDDYMGLTDKVKGILDYALANGYDYLFKTDDDTFVYVDRLLASGYEKHDYTGYCTNNPAHPKEQLYASGGSGYWLSRKAMEILAKASPDDWAEDRWVGKVLYNHKIPVVRDARYLPGFREHYVDLDKLPENHSYITLHAVAPENMAAIYNRTVNLNFKLVNRAIGDDTHSDDPESILQDLMQELKESEIKAGNAVNNNALEKLARRYVELLQKIETIEERIRKFNVKSSQKI